MSVGDALERGASGARDGVAGEVGGGAGEAREVEEVERCREGARERGDAVVTHDERGDGGSACGEGAAAARARERVPAVAPAGEGAVEAAQERERVVDVERGETEERKLEVFAGDVDDVLSLERAREVCAAAEREEAGLGGVADEVLEPGERALEVGGDGGCAVVEDGDVGGDDIDANAVGMAETLP